MAAETDTGNGSGNGNRAEIETARLRAETDRHLAEIDARKHEARWGAIKAIGVAFVGTFAIGAITSIVNYQIQSNQLRLEEERTKREISLEEARFAANDRDAQRQLEQEYLQQFMVDALSEDIQRRVDVAQYIASVTLDEEMRGLWNTYHATLEAELTSTRKDLQDKVAELERQMSEGATAGTEQIRALEQEIAELRGRLAGETAVATPTRYTNATFTFSNRGGTINVTAETNFSGAGLRGTIETVCRETGMVDDLIEFDCEPGDSTGLIGQMVGRTQSQVMGEMLEVRRTGADLYRFGIGHEAFETLLEREFTLRDGEDLVIAASVPVIRTAE